MGAAVDIRPDAVTPRPSGLRALPGLGHQDRVSLVGMGITVGLLHLVGFGILFGVVAPHRYPGASTAALTVGIGVLAYTLGLRHAFDADHIAAIDNTTRKLLSGGEYGSGRRHPLSVGFWFSLGHSSVVLALVVLLSVGVKALAGQVESDGSRLHAVTGIIGASVSGVFLWVIGLVNLGALIRIAGVFARMRGGDVDEAELEEVLDKRGFMNRWLGGLSGSVRAPWQLYPIGLLFGSGVRHGDRGGVVGVGRWCGGGAVAGVHRDRVAGVVRGGDVVDGQCRWDCDDGGVWVGVSSAGAQGVLQLDGDVDLGVGGVGDRDGGVGRGGRGSGASAWGCVVVSCRDSFGWCRVWDCGAVPGGVAGVVGDLAVRSCGGAVVGRDRGSRTRLILADESRGRWIPPRRFHTKTLHRSRTRAEPSDTEPRKTRRKAHHAALAP
ncbi:MAG: hypothetical protein LKI24_02860 [Acidipropionibacterium sp.]|nr:hypothetical protein [Acidipropionibacterium sp.]